MQRKPLQNSGRIIDMKHSVFFVIQGDKVIVTDVLYSASDIENRLKDSIIDQKEKHN